MCLDFLFVGFCDIVIATMESDATTVGGDGTAGIEMSASAASLHMSNFLISVPAASLTTVGLDVRACHSDVVLVGGGADLPPDGD